MTAHILELQNAHESGIGMGYPSGLQRSSAASWR